MSTLTEEGKDFLLSLPDIDAGVVPLCSNGKKHPPILWKCYMPSPKDKTPSSRPTKDMISDWFKQYKNFGLVLGWEYYALDFDTYPKGSEELHPDTAAFLDFLLRNTRVWVQKTGSTVGVRRHLIYKKDPTKPLGYNQHTSKYPGLEILGENHILVLAGSIHPSGGVYETLRSPFDNEIDVFPYEYLADEINVGDTRKGKTKTRNLSLESIITSRHNDARDYYLELKLNDIPEALIDNIYLDHINANYPEV